MIGDDNIVMIIFFIILILLIPLFVQIKYRVSALSGWIKYSFLELTLFCLFLEIIISVVIFFLIAFIESLVQPVNQTPRCGMGLAGITIFGIPIVFLILLIALIQYGANKNNS